MKIAIIYASKHGTTEKVARSVGEKLTGDVELFSLSDDPRPDIGRFDTVILGTSIYAGQPLKKMKVFCVENEDMLLQKRLGLFVCGMEPSREGREKEIKAAYADVLREKAVAAAFLGGEFLFESMKFHERLVAGAIAKTRTSVSLIDQDGIDDFVQKLR